MLVVMRREGEVIVCTMPNGELVKFHLVAIERNRARIGIEAPQSVLIDRHEVWMRRQAEKGEIDGNH